MSNNRSPPFFVGYNISIRMHPFKKQNIISILCLLLTATNIMYMHICVGPRGLSRSGELFSAAPGGVPLLLRQPGDGEDPAAGRVVSGL